MGRLLGSPGGSGLQSPAPKLRPDPCAGYPKSVAILFQPRGPRPHVAALAWPPGLLLASPASARLLCLHRKVYFAQSHKPPFHGRVCAAPPGCLLSSSPDGPTKGFFYVPSEKGTWRGGCLGAWGGRAPPSRTDVTPSAVPKARLSATFGFNPCVNTSCGKPAVRPLVDTGAMVFVVFGIIGINRTRQVDNHVIGDPVRGPTLGGGQKAQPHQAHKPAPARQLGPPAPPPHPLLVCSRSAEGPTTDLEGTVSLEE